MLCPGSIVINGVKKRPYKWPKRKIEVTRAPTYNCMFFGMFLAPPSGQNISLFLKIRWEVRDGPGPPVFFDGGL